ncbi:MAG: hypothetical protein WBA54_00590 [Acidaminobacteraceae bacterium]
MNSMNLNIKLVEKSIHVKFSKEIIQQQNYSMDEEVNFTELIIILSELNESITIIPESYETFKTENPNQSDENYKIISYLYRILKSYNECYIEIFPIVAEE